VIAPDKYHTDCACMTCGGSGVVDMGDPERPHDAVPSEYCECQRPLLEADDYSDRVKRTQHVADLHFVDTMMATRGFENMPDDQIEHVAWVQGYEVVDDFFNDLEMQEIKSSRQYVAPTDSAEWFEDTFKIGQYKVAQIRKSTCEGTIEKAVKTVLDTAPVNTLARQSASRIFKAHITEYRRAVAIMASLSVPELETEEA